MMMSEESVSEKTMGNIRGCASDALAILDLEPTAEPSVIVEAVDAFAYRWQKGDRPPIDVVADTEQARLFFGSLWGEQIARQFAWEWARVIFAGGSATFGVVSPDRSLAVYPLDFMLACMHDTSVDVTVALSFNMLMAGSLPEMPQQSYTDFMHGVHRIIPRP